MANTSPRVPRKNATVYVARDIERAFGMDPSPMYRIVTNRSPYAESIQGLFPAYVSLVDGQLDTIDLLKHKAAEPKDDEAVLVFKNTSAIEEFCASKGWVLLNPAAALAERIENKISQVEYLGPIGEKYFPAHIVAPLKEILWKAEPRIIQWAHGHTGGGTILVSTEAELAALRDKFPERPARSTAVVLGPSFTVNAIVPARGETLVGNISYQITGLAPFTDAPFATVGNDWSATHTILTEQEIESIRAMAKEIGAKLQSDGWRGLFGIDVMKDATLDKIFLIEINARQPASTTLESRLQAENRRHGLKGATVLESHLDALRETDALGASGTAKQGAEPKQSDDAAHLIEINDGAQIVQRVTSSVKSVPEDVAGSLELAGYTVIAYGNTAPGEDLIRIQSSRGIIDALGNPNPRCKEIIDSLSDDK